MNRANIVVAFFVGKQVPSETLKERLALGLGCLFPLLLTIGCCVFSYRWTRITDHQQRQIHGQMTKAEVIRVLGKPHGGETMKDDFWIYWTWEHFDPLKLHFDSNGQLDCVSY